MSWVGGLAFEIMTYSRTLSMYLFYLVRAGLGSLQVSAVLLSLSTFSHTPTQDMSCFVLPCK
jgi:hypothetical protein